MIKSWSFPIWTILCMFFLKVCSIFRGHRKKGQKQIAHAFVKKCIFWQKRAQFFRDPNSWTQGLQNTGWFFGINIYFIIIYSSFFLLVEQLSKINKIFLLSARNFKFHFICRFSKSCDATHSLLELVYKQC